MTQRDVEISGDWYAKSFDELYPVIYAHRTIEAASAEAEFSMKATGLTAEDHVLDLCCGNGRHLAHLCHQTNCAVGLDYSPHLLEIAREAVGGCAKLVRADMRTHPFEACFDVVMNYFTSMGYFDEEAENLSVVKSIARSLKPDGRFLIDYMNPVWTEAHLQAESNRRENGYDIHERRWVDHATERINKTTVVTHNGTVVGESGESVKLYTLDEFVTLLKAGGLKIDELYGDYRDVAFGPEHPRMIAVGRRDT